jgi:hypothetical protein
MATSPDFRKSDYIIGYYVEAALALQEFEASGAETDSPEAQAALRKAADRICSALQRLFDDKDFWTNLAGLRGPIAESERDVRKILDDIDELIDLEQKLLESLKLPPAMVRRLLSDLTIALKAFPARGVAVAEMQSGIRDARDTICQISTSLSSGVAPSRLMRILQTLKESLGVLGGVVTIVVDSISAAAAPLALASIVGGFAASLGWIEWMKRRKGKGRE